MLSKPRGGLRQAAHVSLEGPMANGKTKAKKQVLLATALALPPHFEISNAAHRPQTGGLFPPKRQSPYTESSLLPWPTKAHFGAGVPQATTRRSAALKNMPVRGRRHLKYRTPLISPSFFPCCSSSSTPTQSPSLTQPPSIHELEEACNTRDLQVNDLIPTQRFFAKFFTKKE